MIYFLREKPKKELAESENAGKVSIFSILKLI